MRLKRLPRAVGFDLDGTLIDSMPDLASAANRMLGELHLRALPPERIASFVGHGVGQLVTRALQESLQDAVPEPALCAAALEIFRDLYRQHVFVDSRVYPGIPEALRWLNEARIPVCCITNKESSLTAPLLEQSHLAHYFDAVLCADTPLERKPAPRMLHEACRRFGIEPAAFLYVGDSDVDQAAAAAAGCPLLGVRYGFGRIEGAAEAFVARAEEILPLLKALTRETPADAAG